MATDTAPHFFAAHGLAKHFGGIQAVADLTLDIAQGEIIGLIGPNGSGKTTSINMLAGALQPDGGSITLQGSTLSGQPAHFFARHGVARTFQVPRLFRRMSVLENLIVPALSNPHTKRPNAESKAHDVLAFLRLDHLTHDFARSLSGGQQRQVEIARSLMADPSVYLIDEPTAGIDPQTSEGIYDIVANLAHDLNKAVLLVDQDIRAALDITDYVYVVKSGTVVASGPREAFGGDTDALVARWLYASGE